VAARATSKTAVFLAILWTVLIIQQFFGFIEFVGLLEFVEFVGFLLPNYFNQTGLLRIFIVGKYSCLK
jgi:hypothetical protein